MDNGPVRAFSGVQTNPAIGLPRSFCNKNSIIIRAATISIVKNPRTRANIISMRALRLTFIGLSGLVGALLIAWAAGALYFDLHGSAFLRTSASILWVTAAILLSVFGGVRGRVVVLTAFAGILGWWLSLRPSQGENWEPQVATLAYVSRAGDAVTVHDIRNFEYRSATEFTPRYETRTFDLANLRSLDLFINYWGSPYKAHPIGYRR